MVVTRSQTAAAAAVAAVHAAAAPPSGSQRRVRVVNNADIVSTMTDSIVAAILLGLKRGEPAAAQTHASQQAAQGRPRRACAKY